MDCSQVQEAGSWVDPAAVLGVRLPASKNLDAFAPVREGLVDVVEFGSAAAVDACLVHGGAAEVHRKSLASPLGGQMGDGGHDCAHAGNRARDPVSAGSELALTAGASALPVVRSSVGLEAGNFA